MYEKKTLEYNRCGVDMFVFYILLKATQIDARSRINIRKNKSVNVYICIML